jgi:hypothetical protein
MEKYMKVEDNMLKTLIHNNRWMEQYTRMLRNGKVKAEVIERALDNLKRPEDCAAIWGAEVTTSMGVDYEVELGRSMVAREALNNAIRDARERETRESGPEEPQEQIEEVDYSGLLEVLRETREHEDEEEPQERPQRGRPIYDLRYRILSNDKTDKEAFLEHFTNLARGKKGKDLGLIVTAAIEGGLMTKPTYGEVKTAVGDDIGSPSGYNRYAGNKNAFAKHEREAMIEKLKDY